MARLALATWCVLVVFIAAGESLSAPERSHESVVQVIQDKAAQPALGVALFFLSFPILFFNERRRVTMYAVFRRVASLTSTLVRPDQMDTRLDRRLVHMQAATSTASVLEDREFGVTVSHALALTRECERSRRAIPAVSFARNPSRAPLCPARLALRNDERNR